MVLSKFDLNMRAGLRGKKSSFFQKSKCSFWQIVIVKHVCSVNKSI